MNIVEAVRRRLAFSPDSQREVMQPREALFYTAVRLKRIFSDTTVFEHRSKEGDVLGYTLCWRRLVDDGIVVASNEVKMKSDGEFFFKGEDGWIPTLTFSRDPVKRINDAVKRSQNLLHSGRESFPNTREIELAGIGGSN